jgi:hypothetical protein
LSSVRRVRDDDTRYAVMVGAMAAACGAHSVSAIDRRITNRHLMMFGGYAKQREAAGNDDTASTGHYDW